MTTVRADRAVRVDVLGPLRLHVAGEEVEVRGSRRRALLAVLALASGRPVGVERLIDALWPDNAPDNATQALYSHVSRLRADLDTFAGRLRRDGAGYRLVLEDDELDADAARRLAQAVTAPGADPSTRAAGARAALQLWRGPALEEFAAFPDLEVQSVGLAELRLQLVDVMLESRLALGEDTVAVDAAAAAAAAPLRERTTLLLVRALAAEGRSADAMAAAQAYRRRLVEETGLDPSPALAELEQQVAGGQVPASAAGRADLSRPVAGAPVRPDGPIVGRRHDRDQLARLLEGHAVVTLAGPGGVGKTTLALDVAADPEVASAGTAVVVDLAAVERADRVGQSVTSTLGLRVGSGAGPDDVAAALVDQPLLLVLDNCEHVVDACRELVGAIRGRAAGVRVLATSRVTLGVPGEYVVRLQPLPVPREVHGLETLRRQPAVQAFVEHARRRRPDFALHETDAEDMVEVLRRLDGLPLGIELAARQLAVMPMSAVRRRLDRALDLATGRQGPAHERQRTLRAMIGATVQLLQQPARDLLLALAPFPGAVELSSIETLAADVAPGADPLELLHQVVDTSLLAADAGSGHYRLLFTVRSFLLDELATRDALEAAERRFLDHVVTMAADIARAGSGAGEPAADARLRRQLDNLRAARDIALRHGRTDVRVGITRSLADLSGWRDVRELWSWALELAAEPEVRDHADRAEVLSCAAEAARLVGDFDRSSRLADEAFADEPDEQSPRLRWAWAARGAVAHFRGDFETARECWVRASRCSEAGSGALLASAALASAYGGDRATARELLTAAHETNRRLGLPSGAALAAYVEGELVAADDPSAAVQHYQEAIECARRSGARYFEGVARVGLASARTRSGDPGGAADEFGLLVDLWTRTGHTTQLWTTVRNAAELLLRTGRRRTAALMLVCADAQPSAAAVSQTIARHSGRFFVPLQEVAPPGELEELRAEAARLGSQGVLDLARAELAALSRSAR